MNSFAGWDEHEFKPVAFEAASCKHFYENFNMVKLICQTTMAWPPI